MRIFVVIVTYNGVEWIEACLNSLKQSSVEVSIIVVDNNSTDSTLELLEGKHSDIHMIRNRVNLGFGKANNIGINYALNNNADFVFLLNQDVRIEQNVIGNLVNVSNNNPGYGILSPIHYNGTGEGLDVNFSNNLSHTKEILYDVIRNKMHREVYEMPFVNAACWLLPVSTFDIVGGFDPIFNHYVEDNNYCQRLKFHKLKIGIVPNSYIYHDREKRRFQRADKFSVKYFQNYYNNLLLEFADINEPWVADFRIQEKKKYLNACLHAILRIDINNAKGFYKQYKLVDDFFGIIEESRATNLTKGRLYLEE